MLLNRCLSGLFVVIACTAASCFHSSKPPEKDLVKDPARLEERVSANIRLQLSYALENNGMLNDSVLLKNAELLNKVYDAGHFKSIWSDGDYWKFIEIGRAHV